MSVMLLPPAVCAILLILTRSYGSRSVDGSMFFNRAKMKLLIKNFCERRQELRHVWDNVNDMDQ